MWRNLLVTNLEFCRFLNGLRAAGVRNVIGGAQLLCNESMPHERGGRIHFDRVAPRYYVSPGYEHHPVYWVTWIGAICFARYAGARLPTKSEMGALASRVRVDLKAINADYRIGDVLPVAEENPPADGIHHAVGNVQVWCADGPTATDLPVGPATRFMHGAAWNTPATVEEVRNPKARHLTGSSRGVGIRLVRDVEADLTAESTAALAASVRKGFAILRQRQWSLRELENAFVAALS